MLVVPVETPSNLAPFFRSVVAALKELQEPTRPVKLWHVALKVDLPDAADWPLGAIICDEIHSIVVSTLVTGAYAWKRADGSNL